MLPPILAGSFTPDTKRRVQRFYIPIAEIFESWVTRRQAPAKHFRESLARCAHLRPIFVETVY
jgi:hypothetical protein